MAYRGEIIYDWNLGLQWMRHVGSVETKDLFTPLVDLRCGSDPEDVIKENISATLIIGVTVETRGDWYSTYDIELNLDVSTGGLMKGWGNCVVFDHGIVQTRKYGIAVAINEFKFIFRVTEKEKNTYRELRLCEHLRKHTDSREWLRHHDIDPMHSWALRKR